MEPQQAATAAGCVCTRHPATRGRAAACPAGGGSQQSPRPGGGPWVADGGVVGGARRGPQQPVCQQPELDIAEGGQRRRQRTQNRGRLVAWRSPGASARPRGGQLRCRRRASGACLRRRRRAAKGGRRALEGRQAQARPLAGASAAAAAVGGVCGAAGRRSGSGGLPQRPCPAWRRKQRARHLSGCLCRGAGEQQVWGGAAAAAARFRRASGAGRVVARGWRRGCGRCIGLERALAGGRGRRARPRHGHRRARADGLAVAARLARGARRRRSGLAACRRLSQLGHRGLQLRHSLQPRRGRGREGREQRRSGMCHVCGALRRRLPGPQALLGGAWPA